jgi:transposase
MLEVSDEAIETLSLDHHGIVAGICKELRIAERINEQLKVHDKRIVSPGQAVVSMIINGLGFTNRRLYLSHQFFANKPIELLLESGLKAEDITDYTLGHTLDEIYEYGSSELFATIGFSIALEHKLLGSNLHLDTTSISVDGEYKSSGDEHVVNITHGYSKDMRRDLKQVVMSLAVSGASNLPIFMEALDGNSSDKTSFHETIKKINDFKAQINLDHDFKWVADSALYTPDKLLQSEYLWLTRVPETR